MSYFIFISFCRIGPSVGISFGDGTTIGIDPSLGLGDDTNIGFNSTLGIAISWASKIRCTITSRETSNKALQ